MTNFPMPLRSMSLDFIAFGVAAAAALVVPAQYVGGSIAMSAVAQLKSDVTALEAEHDALVRAIARKHQELDALNTQIKANTDRLDRIKSEIAKVKAHFGIMTS